MTNSLYSGISFPARKDSRTGFWLTTTDEQLIKESIFVILNTKKGEMPMNPAFGNSVDEILFENTDHAIQGIVCQQLQQDIETWEPRVSVRSIASYSKDNERLFDIQLTLKTTGQQFSVSVPLNP
jgi:phage baseplate assembly protein W